MFDRKYEYKKYSCLVGLILLLGQCFIVAEADVVIDSLTQSPANPVIIGDTVTYSLTVTNTDTGEGSVFIEINMLLVDAEVSGTFTSATQDCGLDGIFFCNQLLSGSTQTYIFTTVLSKPGDFPFEFIVGCGTQCVGDAAIISPATTVIAESVSTSAINISASPGASATETFSIISLNPTTISAITGQVSPTSLPAGGGEVTYSIVVPVESQPGEIIADTITIADDAGNLSEIAVEVTVSGVSTSTSAINISASPGASATETFSIISLNPTTISAITGQVSPTNLPAGGGEVTYSIVVPVESQPGEIIADTITIADDAGNLSEIAVEVTVSGVSTSTSAINISASPGASATETFSIISLNPTTISAITGQVSPTSLPAGGGEVTYSIVVPVESQAGEIIADTITIADDAGNLSEIAVEVTVSGASTSTSAINISASPGSSATETFSIINLNPTTISAITGQVSPTSLPAGGGEVTYSIVVPVESQAGEIIEDTITIADDAGNLSEIAVEVTVSGVSTSTSAINISALPGASATEAFSINSLNQTTISVITGQVSSEILPAGGGEVTYSIVVPVESQPGEIIEDTITIADDAGNLSEIAVEVTVSAQSTGFADVPGLTDNERQVAETLDNACNALNQSESLTESQVKLQSVCNSLDGLVSTDPATAASALQQITPTQAPAQANLSVQSSNTQLKNVDARMSALRSGASGYSVSGLTLSYGGLTLPANLFSSQQNNLLLGVNEDSTELSILPKLGIFVNGNVSFGDKEDTDDELGFDFNTYGLTAGADYRLRDALIVGGALGIVNTDSDFNHSQGNVDISGLSVLAYSTYFLNESTYLEGVISLGRNNFDNTRNISVGSITYVAKGETDGNEQTISFGAGYDFSKGPTTLGSYVKINYIRAEIDGYTESTNSGLELTYQDQASESLAMNVGGQLSYAISKNFGIILPTLRLDWTHEYKDDNSFITASFLNDPSQAKFTIQTDSPDRDYFQLGLGASVTFGSGRSAFFFYESILGQANLSKDSLIGGLRIDF